MTIGEVLSELSRDFPDVSISKIRFLEGEGLIRPQRAPSGYRRFTAQDLATLRLILTAQRDRYLPLRVIKEHLADDSLRTRLGFVPDHEPEPEPQDEVILDIDPKALFTRREIAGQSGLSLETIDGLAEASVIQADPTGKFSGADLLACRAFARLASYGMEQRHMSQMKVLASRNVHMVTSLVVHLQGPERDSAMKDLAKILADSLYWQMVSGMNRESPPAGYRPQRPRRR